MEKFVGTNEYFKSLDSYLEENLKTLTCNDICDIYSSMSRGLQEVKGNTNGFTGFSELIIFRYLIKYFSGTFGKKGVEGSKTLEEFNNGTYTIAQSCRLIVNGKRKYPDIVIRKCNEVISVIQIKVYVTNGVKEAEREISDFLSLRNENVNMKGRIIIFSDYKEKSRVRKVFEEFSKQHAWFKMIILANEDVFYNLIRESI